MAGRVPVIHAWFAQGKTWDGRDKHGHDGFDTPAF
jgi:hypothetical protein